ncbi:DUF2867 domain-containing protein [Kineococcus aurantiacus]|uniref:DUF2867 domain-containing protein n=1 Tax=Kineococcus aurantiacus TaxID=37633 RepID=A0A7Y9DNJ9_9ACTN|nr:DUF2867 domain-containing protein [Kineococcus aurantiacus]NYD23897.1 hypothetical protein [Kineococcus aurantiacus]
MTFTSCVFDDMARPDYCDLHAIALPAGAPADPAVWARTMFSPRAAPPWVAAALAVRQALAPLVGVPRAGHEAFGVVRVAGDEALVAVDDVHLDFRCALGVDVEAGRVRCTTAVRLKNRRGRFYFRPVALAHGPVVESMLRRTGKVLAGHG